MAIEIRRIVGIAQIVMLITVIECSSSRVSENAHDVISVAYTNMNSSEYYSVKTEFNMTLQYTKEVITTSVHSHIAAHKEPFEMIIKTTENQRGEREKTSYRYQYEEGEKTYDCRYLNGAWERKEDVENKSESKHSPVDFGVYFVDIDSFEIVKEERDVLILEGKIAKDKVEETLKEVGALRQLALSSFPMDQLKDIPNIRVRAWVDKETNTIKKVEIELKETMQAVINRLLGEDSVMTTTVNDCMFCINHIEVNQVEAVGLPKDSKEELETLKSKASN